MFHFQGTPNDWPRAVARLPDKCCVKAVDRADILRDAKAARPGIFTILRHWDDSLQHYDGNMDLNVWKDRARHWFSTHIDGTFRQQYAQFVDAVSWHNEIWANSQNDTERQERIIATQAAVSVWNNEYRSQSDYSHIQLVIGEAAVGNWIPWQIGRLAVQEDCIVGYHPYTAWGWDVPKKRWGDNEFDEEPWDTLDWYNLSGLWDTMEHDWGWYPNWAFTEAGPFGDVIAGWRGDKVCGSDPNLYVYAVRDWLKDVQLTNAYKQGRIKGFTLFTSGGGSQWKLYETKQPEMDMLADMIAAEWKPGAIVPPPPPPPPPDDEDRGKPRVQYQRVYHVMPQNWPAERVGRYAAQIWEDSKGTVGGSWDDAMIGDLDKRTAMAYDILPNEYASFIQFRDTYYPGAVLKFIPWLSWPLDRPKQASFQSWALFNAEREYGPHEGLDLQAEIGDGVFAMRDGVVTWSSNKKRSDPSKDSLYGNHIIIDHGGGWFTWYAHLDDMISAVDDIVFAGDLIGYAGNTGNSTGPHLHINVQSPDGLNGYVVAKVVNPRPLLGV